MSKKIVLAAALGAALATTAMYLLRPMNHGADMAATKEDKPLYWVAPMDAAYQRDKPGKSPMGMDLVPVYASASSAADEGPGTVYINPAVQNNLGVRTVQAVMSTLTKTIQTVGYVQYNQDKMLHIHPRIAGWVEQLYIKAEGEPVLKGQALYRLYAPQLVAAQEELILALNRSNKELIAGAENRLAALQLGAKFIRQLKRSKKVQQTITFYAPQSGVIDNLSIRQGGYVKPGQSLMSIADLNEVWVEAEVFSAQAEAVKVGLPVAMSLEYLPGRQWMGEVDYVYPSLNQHTRTLRVRMRFANKKLLLKPNMFADIKIISAADKQALVVPSEAVIRTGSQNRVVLALGEGRFKSIAVKLGRKDGRFIEILEGLAVGERVVSSAQFLIDSESSKSSDFKRMESPSAAMADMDGMAAMSMAAMPASVWVVAEVQQLMAATAEVRLKHDAIPQWQQPAMTMTLGLAAALSVDAIKLKQPMKIQLSQKPGGGLQLTAVLPLAQSQEANHD